MWICMNKKTNNTVLKEINVSDLADARFITSEEIEQEVLGKELTRTENIDWSEIKGLHDLRSDYTADQKINALTGYIMTGSYAKSAELAGVPAMTIRRWAGRSTWWPLALEKIRDQQSDELDARISLVIKKTMDKIEDRIVNGDEIILSSGRRTKRKLSGKDLTSIIATLYDKRALLRGEPTRRVAEEHNVGKKDVLNTLKESFEQMSKDIQKDKQEKVIN